MIDLSFLTEEEQQIILTVLKRDAELKRAEELRVKNLQKSVTDKGQLKYLTGEWFYETKMVRHQDRIHGSDIIRASMRQRQKPLTILEVSQIWPEQASFVSSENQDVYIPPVLCGLIEEPPVQFTSERDNIWNPYEKPQEVLKPVLQSPTKQRQNPFNSEPVAPTSVLDKQSQSADTSLEQSQTFDGGPCEQGHIELLNPQVSNLSTGQAPGKPVHQATGPEEDGHSKGYDDDSSPLRSALKQMSSRPTSMSSSKSLENLTSQTTSEQSSKSALIRQVNRSVDDVSAIPPSAFSIVDPEPVRHDEPVADFQQEEMDSDSTSENTMAWRRNTGSSMSNISISSGMSSISGSMGSLYPVDVGDVEVQGTIQFAVNYVQKVGEFHIFVVHCHDLAVAEPKKSRSDPYVKCYLLPDITKMGKRKTSVKKKTLNPTYNEILQFKVTMEVLRTQKLNVSVWHNDTFGRNTFLGEVDVDLSRWDFSNTEMNVYTLKARVSSQLGTTSLSPATDKRGLMRVALRFLPQISQSKKTSKMETGEVQIWVKDCKNLPPVRGVIIDPFVKCTVLPDTSRKSRQKTRVVKRTTNPMFNHTMVYDGFRPEDLKEACVELTVWDHDRLNNHYIGGLRLGLGTGKSYGAEVAWMDSTTNEAYLWQRMMQSHGEWVEDVLPLRMLVMAKSMSK
ncbi:synaptotagmin-like protein 2 isoform X1 [Lampris incognitus]|uniref:synaptotagmin-like protein 2 isoform X1 n=2 Tax=Lampris incognitus TaxID=2546036 RepID=UPI0024B616A0|nr:synaptotagmin-like protein 2 isoform X1 [Lampris incognitus]